MLSCAEIEISSEMCSVYCKGKLGVWVLVTVGMLIFAMVFRCTSFSTRLCAFSCPFMAISSTAIELQVRIAVIVATLLMAWLRSIARYVLL